jgi:phosphoadenosine phosphosulfate reductase
VSSLSTDSVPGELSVVTPVELTVGPEDVRGRSLVFRAARDLEGAPAEEVLTWAATTFPGSFAVTSSMTDTVLAHLVGRVAPEVPVLFIDTGFHFRETLETAERVRAEYSVDLRVVQTPLSVAEQDERFGPRLFERDPTQCCSIRKVEPLDAALEGFDAWGSGLRWADSPERSGTPVVAWDLRRHRVKVNPIASWSDADLAEYGDRHGTITNPLLADGYPSVGCAPCTRRVLPGDQPRAGRWAGTDKVECGIHDLIAGP